MILVGAEVEVGVVVHQIQACVCDKLFELARVNHTCETVFAGHKLSVPQVFKSHLIINLSQSRINIVCAVLPALKTFTNY